MKPIFNRKPAVRARLILAVIISIIMILASSQINSFKNIRYYLDSSISPLHFVVEKIYNFFENFSKKLISQKKLIIENKRLKRELYIKNSELLLLQEYKKNIIRLSTLLHAVLYKNEHKILARVISSLSDHYIDQVLIDKGRLNNVYPGQPVISDKGVVGQVMTVNKTSSRVLLICDEKHGLPVQVLRNDIRLIAFGNGCSKNLTLESFSRDIDIHIGDILVTSGIEGRFPVGYPVGVIFSIIPNTQKNTIFIEARPTANLKYLNYLLLLNQKPSKKNKMVNE